MNVVLYSTNCPKCKVLEKKLDSIGIDYKIVTDEDLMISKGFSSAPMLEVDDNIMDFGNAVRWAKEQK
jgi:glutaredoxin